MASSEQHAKLAEEAAKRAAAAEEALYEAEEDAEHDHQHALSNSAAASAHRFAAAAHAAVGDLDDAAAAVRATDHAGLASASALDHNTKEQLDAYDAAANRDHEAAARAHEAAAKQHEAEALGQPWVDGYDA